VAEAVDGRFAPLFARVPVQAARSGLILAHYYSQGSLLVLKVKDDNEVPYSNVKLAVEGYDVEIRTDAQGLAWINRDPAREVVAEVEGAPGTRLVVKAEN
jgi:hypothetical protein